MTLIDHALSFAAVVQGIAILILFRKLREKGLIK